MQPPSPACVRGRPYTSGDLEMAVSRSLVARQPDLSKQGVCCATVYHKCAHRRAGEVLPACSARFPRLARRLPLLLRSLTDLTGTQLVAS
jgi:hypothetical protein